MGDPYREWGPEERSEAWRNGDRDGCRRYDEGFESSSRAYESWKNGGDFSDPNPNGRFH
jgi:hypothetical protein